LDDKAFKELEELSVMTGSGEVLAALYPELSVGAEECWMEIEGGRMRYLRAGSGPALILLHGLLGYSFSWRFTLPALAPYATVYAPDMMGAGFSDHPKRLDCTLRASAGRLLAFLQALGISACDMMGASQGGAVVMMAAALVPERVRRLILVAPVNPWSSQGAWRAAFLSNRMVAPILVRLAPHLKSTHPFFVRRLFGDPGRIPPDALAGYSMPFAIPGALEHRLALVRSWREDLQELKMVLPKIRHIHAQLIWGSKDRAVSPASAEELRRQFSDCDLRVFSGVGHLPYEEVPEEFNRAVVDCLLR
jgi:pimeloyl-ACP methyl ester carboxylesterase